MTLKLKGDSAGSVSFAAPADTSPSASDVSFTLPTADGTNGQVLSTDGSGQLSFIDSSADKIEEGNTKVETVDTGTDGHILLETEGSERFRVGPAGQLGIAGANYGTDGQVLTSTGANTAPAWETLLEFGDANLTHQGSTTAGTYVMSNNSRYCRIGNLIHLFIDERVESVTSAGSGTMQLTNLPYNRASTDTNYSCQAAVFSIPMSQSDHLRGFGFMFDHNEVDVINYFMNSNNADPPSAQGVLAAGDRLVGVLTYECTVP